MTDARAIENKSISPGLNKIQSGMYFGGKSGGIYETTKAEVEPDTQNQGSSSLSGTGKPWASWGHDNDYPQRLIDAVKSDPVAALLEKKAAFHYGRGLMFYKKEVDEKGNEKIIVVPDKDVPSEILEFMRVNKFKKFMHGIIADFEWWHCYHVEYITNNAGNIIEVHWQKTKNVRPAKRDNVSGEVKKYYLSGHWPNPKDGYYREVNSFDENGKGSGILCHSQISIDKDYFSDPAWHGITRWLYIASKIPRWILANIDNSMNIKYHIEIPWKYFLDRVPEDAYKTKAEYEEALNKYIEDTFKKLDDYLAGEKNVHKAFYSFIHLMEDGKTAPGWKITELKNDPQHEAWLKAYGTAAIAMISGIGLSPSIAGSILPNGLGQGSGSDLREQFNFYIQVMTTIPREITLEPWEIIKYRNKWPEWLHLGFRDIVLQSIDQNKSGFQQQNEQAPTNDSQNNQIAA